MTNGENIVINKQKIEALIEKETGVKINSADRIFKANYEPKWFMNPGGWLRKIAGLPLRSYIEYAYDCDDLQREYKTWLVNKNAKYWDVAGHGTMSGLAIPVFMAHVKIDVLKQSHWILMCLTNSGWIYIDYIGDSVKTWPRHHIEKFYEIHA